MQELNQVKKDSDFEEENGYWDEIEKSTKEENILRLIEESKKCEEAEALNATVVMLWAATMEKIKVMCLFFPKNELQKCRHISESKVISAPKDFKLEDEKIIDIAEDLGLVKGNEGVVLQSIRTYVRNKCAHGEDVEISQEDIAFIKKNLLDSVYSKTDRAGITPKKIKKLIDKGEIPSDMLNSVNNFSESEQFELSNELYDLRKELPLTRMDRRDNYLQREGHYSYLESEKRETVKEAFDHIWPLLNESVKSQVSRKAKKDMLDSEGAIGFLMERGLTEFNQEDKNKILQEFFGGKYPKDYEDGNDVAINLFLASKNMPEEITRENLEEIYAFSLTKTNYDKKSTLEFYSKFLSNLNEQNKNKLVDLFDDRILEAEQRWGEDIDKDWTKSRFLNGDEYRFFDRYFSIFDEFQQTRIIDILSESVFYEIESIEKKVDEYREEKTL